jgi:sec-independent protein translocase protein TatA
VPGNIGWQGAIVIILVLLLVFGPKRLPEMGRSVGRGIREFKDSLSGNDTPDEPEKATLTPPAATAAPATPAQPDGENASSAEPERVTN